MGTGLFAGPLQRGRRAWHRARRSWLRSKVGGDLRRLGRVYLNRPWPGYLDRHRAGTAPLREDRTTYDPLFQNAVANFERVLSPYARDRHFPMARVWNGWFESVDVELYHAYLRTLRPRLVIEVGSGYSTGFAIEALRRNGRGRIVSIDPEPRADLPASVEHVQAVVEEVPLSVFEELADSDVLFIDSSHTADEARYHVDRIFPVLRPGVVCHHHDIVFPWAVYPLDDPATFGEVNVLLEFYLRNREAYEVLTGSAYVRWRDPELVRRLVRSYRSASDRIPTSLWARKLPTAG